jgi:hypothetical protein
MIEAPKSLKYIRSDDKPPIDSIQQYLDNRLQNNHDIGLIPSNDFLGNIVITSLEHEEQTLAGLLPATIVASPEGVHIIANNPGILSEIYDGTVSRWSNTLGGHESRVYTIFLITDTGLKEFALKYTFPINDGGDKFFTSGIIAMRMMQLIEKKRPVPYIHYTVPVFATHDFTVAPFSFHGISTSKLLNCLEYPDKDYYKSRLLDEVFTQTERDMIWKMTQWEYHAFQNNQPRFIYHVNKVIDNQGKILIAWVDEQIHRFPEFRQHRYSSRDTSLRQSVVNLDKIYTLYKKYYSNPLFISSYPTFTSELLNSLSLVELGVGRVLDL